MRSVGVTGAESGSWGLRHIAAAVVLLVTCGCSIATDVGSTPGRHLRIEWRAGSVTSFEAQLIVDGPDSTGKQTHDVISGLATLTVGAVDSSGNASIEVRLVSYPPHETAQPVLFLVDVGPDGRVIANPDGQGYDLTNLYEMFPLLPPSSVLVGDLWHETYDMPNALSRDPFHFSIDGTYARDETISGTSAVVIQAHMSCSFDMTFMFMKAYGSVPAGYPADLTVHEVGTIVNDDTFWFQPVHHALIKSSGTEQFQYVAVYTSPSTGETFGRSTVAVSESKTFTNTQKRWPALLTHR